MSSHILIFGGFITVLLDDMHVILRHIHYPPRSSRICLFVHIIVIERISLVMAFLGFHHVLIDATLGHTPYLSGSFGCVCLYRQILVEMSSHILIFGGFITFLLDDIHVILGHIPYPLRSSGICLFVHTIVTERMSLVMTFSGFHHVLIDATLGHIPYLSGSFGGGRFVQTDLIKDMSHCYDIFGLHHVSIGCRIRAYPSNFVFTISRSNVQTSSSAYQAFRLRLHMDQMFRLHLHHIC